MICDMKKYVILDIDRTIINGTSWYHACSCPNLLIDEYNIDRFKELNNKMYVHGTSKDRYEFRKQTFELINKRVSESAYRKLSECGCADEILIGQNVNEVFFEAVGIYTYKKLMKSDEDCKKIVDFIYKYYFGDIEFIFLTSGYEPFMKGLVKEYMKSFHKNCTWRTIGSTIKFTIIFTTHDMQDIVSTCERLIIIDKGKKIYDGAVKNVKELCDDVKILRVEMAQGEKVSNDVLLNIKECDENIVEIMFEKPKLQLERVSKYLNDNYLVKSIRPMSSEQDILEVVTKDSQMIVDTTIYESEKIHDNHFRIKLKDVNTQLGATLNKFVTEYDIKDVLIKEPEISEIVYNIYEGKVELKK